MPQIIIADLTTESIEKYQTDNQEYGRGLAIRLLIEQTPGKCPRLGKENVFVIAPGLLTGTPVPCASRASIAARDDQGFGASVGSITGDLPQKLASLGVAALVIKGKSNKKDVVFYMDEGKIELCHMPELQGVECGQAVDRIRNKWGKDSAVAGCGPAAERCLPLSSLFTTYPEGLPRFSCPRSSFGDVPASKGLRAVVANCRQYFNAECKEKDMLKKTGKDLARYIVDDPICGGALPGLGSITLLHLLKNKGAIPAELSDKAEHGNNKMAHAGQKINYCCAPMCVIGCLNRHSGISGKLYGAPEESEVRAATEQCFQQYFSERELDDCAGLLAEQGMRLGINITELVYAIALYLEAVNEIPTLQRVRGLLEELKQGTALGRVLGGGTAAVGRLFRDKGDIQKKITEPAVQKEKQHHVEMDHKAGEQSESVSDMELLYQEIFLFENLGICIFSAFALLNKTETLQILAKLYEYKTGRQTTVKELLAYAEACLRMEDELRISAQKNAMIRSIPEFVKVLYQYFGHLEK